MATFYGMVEGNRGPATRVGSASSGIHTAAQSWDGSVSVKLRYYDDELMVHVETSNSSSPYGGFDCPEFYGTFNEFKELLEGAKK